MNLPSENLRKPQVEINQKSTQAVRYVIEIVYRRYIGANRSYVEGNKINHNTAIESSVQHQLEWYIMVCTGPPGATLYRYDCWGFSGKTLRCHGIVTTTRLKEARHCMPHSGPSILTLGVCKGKGAIVHISLLFTARLHFLLFGERSWLYVLYM